MRYALSKGTALRREWFGCLCYQIYNGRFWQLNEDAYEILRQLKKPLSIEKLRDILYSLEMEISLADLQSFISTYESQGLISQRDETSEVLVFNENEECLRNDCLSTPTTVTIYITDYCHKKCRHCATTAHKNIDLNKELKLDNWVKVLKKLRQDGILILVVSGGEPLAIPHTLNFLQIADDMQFGLNLLTDYDNISDQQIAALKSLKYPLNIQTSLDGADAGTHDFLRGNGSFAKTIRRFDSFKEAEMIFTASVSVHKKNINQLQKIADLAYQHGASYIYLNAVAPYGRAKETMKDYLLEESDLKEMAQFCLRWAVEDNIKLRNPFWAANIDRLGDMNFHPFSGTLNAMSLGIYNFTINSRGDCYLDAKQRAEKFLLLGNILEKDIGEMWNDPRLDVLREIKIGEKFTYASQAKIESALTRI